MLHTNRWDAATHVILEWFWSCFGDEVLFHEVVGAPRSRGWCQKSQMCAVHGHVSLVDADPVDVLSLHVCSLKTKNMNTSFGSLKKVECKR